MKISVTNSVYSKITFLLIIIVLNLFMVSNAFAQPGPDPNFYIFLCFGQSNMEGQGTIEDQDKTVNSRFRVMQGVDCSNLGRTKGSWYTATPPTCRCYTGLSQVDYFGRTMTGNLPDSIRVGVINVSVAGCKIELFDKDNYQDYISTVTDDWLINIINEYNGNPYGYLIDLAKQAQQEGVIKGILLHQGESNTGDKQWPSKVKKIYDDMMNDLSLDSGSVPLLAGEVVGADQGGICASMNSIIDELPQTLPNSYVISSTGCTDGPDNLHFNSAGYREIGKRYAVKMLSIMGYEISDKKPDKWVGTWSTAPQLVETGNNPPSPGLSNNTLRQIVHVSIGGDTLRMRFTNEFSTSPVTMHSVHIAVSLGSDTIDTSTDTPLYFSGNEEVTIQPGSAVVSDPFYFPLQPLSNAAITIYFGSTSPDISGHPGSRTTSYILTGNAVTNENFSGAATAEHWYNINTIDVKAPDSSNAVAILGNSITDGRGSGTNKQNRWPDELARRLHANPGTQNIAVLNEGIGGNCVLGTCLGPSALSRFNRDIIEQSGVKWLIILEGINDIGYGAPGTGNNLIDAFKQMIYTAHMNGIFVYGATLLPMKGSSYYSTSHETEREIVNEWIRTTNLLDGVIDLDKAMRNPADTLSLIPEGDSGDHLHPSETGHHMMAEAVDLSLFTGSDSLVIPAINYRSIYFEPECAVVGSNWEIITDPLASNGKYVTVKPGIQSLSAAPADSASAIYIPFSIDTAGNYNFFARLNCPTYDDDSFWARMDNGDFLMYNGLVTSGWQWLKLDSYDLTAGEHKLTITYREDGAELDKICISNNTVLPSGMGEDAVNLCDTTTTGVNNSKGVPDGYVLEQNYPNPFNPVSVIRYSIPKSSHVTIKIFDVLGNEVAALVNGMKQAGIYEVTFNGKGLASGVYLYQLKADGFTGTKKLMLLK
ncbi:MAG: sialate O-acetylesterase [Ignavibacteriaceae bacterium]